MHASSGNGLDSDCRARIRALNRDHSGVELVPDLWL
jgi:hypothetical protein